MRDTLSLSFKIELFFPLTYQEDGRLDAELELSLIQLTEQDYRDVHVYVMTSHMVVYS